jgi:4,5-dihydroxyphthalate decarboxylase
VKIMAKPSITLACRRSERTVAILDGSVKPSGIDLSALEVNDGQKLFSGMLKGEYDASEFSLAELVHQVSRNGTNILGIPIFPTRAFRHGFIFYNTRSGIKAPEDLNGKKIGFRQWVETASVWIRGILVDEYKVSSSGNMWYSVAMHHWEDSKDGDAISAGRFPVRWIEKRGENPVQIAESALLDGRIDVLGMVPAPSSVALRDERIRRLFRSYRDDEVAYFKKTRIFPIMHLVVARASVVERCPDLPKILFQLFVDSKRSNANTRSGPGLVWQDWYVAEESKLFDGDPWTYGLAPNEHVLDKFLGYCHSQGISDRRLVPKNLFFENAQSFTE